MTAHKKHATEGSAASLTAAEETLRDRFAARLAAADFPASHDHDETVAEWAARAYRLADALLAARGAVEGSLLEEK